MAFNVEHTAIWEDALTLRVGLFFHIVNAFPLTRTCRIISDS